MPRLCEWTVVVFLACRWVAARAGHVPSPSSAAVGVGPVLAPLTGRGLHDGALHDGGLRDSGLHDGGLHDLLEQNRTADRLISRRRRYVVFPKRSSIQLVIEFTVPLHVPLTTTIFTTTLTWGLAWRLPSEPGPLYLQRRAAGEDPDHQHRAALLADLAVLFDKLGLRGEDCVRRTLCDLRRGHGTRGIFMEEVLKAVLAMPATAASLDDDLDEPPCAVRYPSCPSALDLPIDRPDPPGLVH